MIEFELPQEIEQQMRAGMGEDLASIARAALVMEGYRTGVLSIGQAARLLGVTIDTTYGMLKARGIPVNYGVPDYEQDVACLRMLIPKAAL